MRCADSIVDETWMIGISQNPVSAVARKTGHPVLEWEPSGLSPFDSCNNDQRPIAEGGERGSLGEGHWQLGKFVALNPVEVRRRYHGTFFVTSWDRQRVRSELIGQPKHS
ncbi:MAG: hypothetical protein E6I71_15870 [Chloroflexi bacterium]|nr:MAG: hypothetical protein E6I71_15870 [Chloroflexota bacterium]